MATFVEKEALIELTRGVVATISRVSSEKEFEDSKDRKSINELVDKLRDTDHNKIDFYKYKAIIDEIEKPYLQIEEAMIIIRNRQRGQLSA